MTSSKNLCELCMPYRSLSLIGMSKNSGKTTTLNTLIQSFDEKNIRLGLTSVGRDGESVDVVTHTGKPNIYIKKGTIIATTTGLLQHCDITKEILMTTSFNTPLGQVVIVNALSNGFVQLGGASVNSQVSSLLNYFYTFGANKVIIDGAVSRKTMASPVVSEAAILCTGASLHNDIRRVVTETAHTVTLFLLPQCDNEIIPNTCTEKTTRLDCGKIYVQGSFSDSYLQKLLLSDTNRLGVHIIVDSADKLFITKQTYEKLLMRYGSIMVRKKINLLAVSINPVSAYGSHFDFDKDEFMKLLENEIAVPIVNVKEQ